jgi:hypothetical protein
MQMTPRPAITGQHSHREIRERLEAKVKTLGGLAPTAKWVGVSRHCLERYLLGGAVYAGSALLLRRAVGLDPLSTNYQPGSSR